MFRFPLLAVLVTALVVCSCDPTVADDPKDPNPLLPPTAETVLTEGVVLTPDREIAYLLTDKRQLSAIRTKGGDENWSSKLFAAPVTLTKGNLLAHELAPEAETGLNLVVVDAATGDIEQRLNRELSRELPLDFRRSNPGKLTLTALGGDANKQVGWLYRPFVKQGSFDPNNPERVFSGTIVLGADGRLIERMQDGPADPKFTRSIIPGSRQRISGQEGQQYLSRDGRHVLVSQVVKPDSERERYRWSVFEAGSNRSLGNLSRPEAFRNFLVTPDGALIFTEGPMQFRSDKGTETIPYQLVSYDLRAGRVAWQRPLFDPVYRGPRPS